MPRGRPTNHSSARTPDTAAKLGFEAKLWQAADALRNNMDAAEYKHVALGLIFLKYISDAFEAKHAELEAQRGEGADPEDRTSTAPKTSSECRRKHAGHI
jgi:type I restriction-modification system DNA methylase subunit